MISLNNERHSKVPPIFKDQACKAKIAEIIENPSGHKVNSIYNDGTVREALQETQFSKCVYCETDVSGGASFRIDHFRPKKKIKDHPDHPGYYWLAYEWTNLLQSCELCNIAKSNNFPLLKESTRVRPDFTPDLYSSDRTITAAPLKFEVRALLHPELDPVERYFQFKRDGYMAPKKGLESAEQCQAKESIKAYGLNRGSLVLRRSRKMDEFQRELIEILNDYEDRGANEFAASLLRSDLRRYFIRMLREQDSSKEYSRLGFFMFDRFIEFFVEPLERRGYEDTKIIREFYFDLTEKTNNPNSNQATMNMELQKAGSF